MIPIFKQNGLTWTLLNTSKIPNILWYSFDPTELASMESDEKKDLSLLIMTTCHIPMRYRQIVNHFNLLCFTIRQGSQYQRKNKVIKITKKNISPILEGLQSEILP